MLVHCVAAPVQHYMSEVPGHRPTVAVPEQHSAEILTQTPSIPPAVHVAEYGQLEIVSKGLESAQAVNKAVIIKDFINFMYNNENQLDQE